MSCNAPLTRTTDEKWVCVGCGGSPIQ